MNTKPLFIAPLLVGIIAHITSGQTASPPINDNFADAIRLTGTSVKTTGSNVGGTKEAGEPNHAGNPGGNSVWWSWTAHQSGYVTVSTDQSMTAGPNSWWLDTLLGIYVGPAVSRLTLIADNDDTPNLNLTAYIYGILDPRSRVVFSVTAGTTYYIAVDGYSELGGPAAEGTLQLALAFYPGSPPGPSPLGSAPSWTLPDVNGVKIDWTNFVGKVVLVNFWATWCGDCLQELPDLVALQQQYAPDGFSVVGISMDESVDTVKSFVNKHSFNYPIVIANPSQAIANAFGGVSGIPASFIVDRKNNIVRRLVGPQKESTVALYVKPLIYANLAVRAACANGRLVLRWPLTQDAFGLESHDDLFSGSWTAWSATVQSDSEGHWIELPMNSSSKYFRLRSQ
jgi:thiol-disulfide isomerase/thioredoxin